MIKAEWTNKDALDLQPTFNQLETDCISRQAAIDALDKRFDSIPIEQTTEILLLRKDLRNLPSAQQWIPCSERLPEEDGSYLVSGKWGSGKESVGDCEFSVEDGYFQTAWNFDVIAWMPLPEPARLENV